MNKRFDVTISNVVEELNSLFHKAVEESILLPIFFYFLL